MAYIGQSPKVKSVKYTPQSSIPSNASEGQVFYSDGTASSEGLYVYKNGAWVSVGSSASGINYITNPDAESGITGWSEFDDGAVSEPVDGTGGTAANITLSQNTSSPLRGVADFKIAKGAADAQGEGVSFDFSIDNADKASVLKISFDYSVTANYADDDMSVFIYDVTNSAIIPVSAPEIKASSQSEIHICTFQTASNSTSYRLILMCVSTNATAYNFNMDNVQVGPYIKTTSPVKLDTKTSSGTLSNTTNNTSSFVESMDGDTLIYSGLVTWSGAGAGTTFDITIPSGYAADATKVPGGVFNNLATVGNAEWYDSSATRSYDLNCYLANSTTLRFNDSSSANSVWDGSQAASGDALSFQVRIPLTGKSSNQIIADEYANRNILLRAQGNGGTSLTANVTNIDFTEVTDNCAAFNGTQFTIPSSGFYIFSGSIRITSAATIGIDSYINGSVASRVGIGSSTHDTTPFFYADEFTAGQVVSFRCSSSVTLTNTASNHYLRVSRIKDSRSLLSEEKVYMRCSGNAASASAGNPVIFPSTDFDSHGAYSTSTGLYTVPSSGIYRISGFVESANTAILLNACKNGTTDVAAGVTDSNGEGCFTTLMNMTKGQTISLEPSGTLDITSGHMAIEKI